MEMDGGLAAAGAELNRLLRSALSTISPPEVLAVGCSGSGVLVACHAQLGFVSAVGNRGPWRLGFIQMKRA
jgi:hypothetical protein